MGTKENGSIVIAKGPKRYPKDIILFNDTPTSADKASSGLLCFLAHGLPMGISYGMSNLGHPIDTNTTQLGN